MNNKKYRELINKLSIFVGTAVGYHLIDKILSIPEEKKNEVLQSIKEHKLQETMNSQSERISNVQEMLSNLQELALNRSKSSLDLELKNSLIKIKDEGLAIKDGLSEINEKYDIDVSPLTMKANNIEEMAQAFLDFLGDDSKKELMGVNLNKFFEFLDTLSLLQESSLLHIIMFICILLTVTNIFSVLLGNEVIKYFKLDQRFPKLVFFINLRLKFQRYYLIWNIVILFLVCICGIGINLLVLIVV